MKKARKERKTLRLLDQLIDWGSSIREKLDKRGLSGVLTAEEVNYEGNIDCIDNEVVGPMRQFLEIFETLKRQQ